MWFFLEILGVAYLASFVWFWTLCRAAARRNHSSALSIGGPSNLIPFERGVEKQMRKTRAM